MIDDEQIAVTPFCPILRDPFAVAIARMAVETRLAYIGRPQAVEGSLKLGDVSLKELFTPIEGLGESHLRHGGRLVLIAALGNVHRGSFLTTHEPLFGGEVSYRLANVVGFDATGVVTLIVVVV